MSSRKLVDGIKRRKVDSSHTNSQISRSPQSSQRSHQHSSSHYECGINGTSRGTGTDYIKSAGRILPNFGYLKQTKGSRGTSIESAILIDPAVEARAKEVVREIVASVNHAAARSEFLERQEDNIPLARIRDAYSEAEASQSRVSSSHSTARSRKSKHPTRAANNSITEPAPEQTANLAMSTSCAVNPTFQDAVPLASIVLTSRSSTNGSISPQHLHLQTNDSKRSSASSKRLSGPAPQPTTSLASAAPSDPFAFTDERDGTTLRTAHRAAHMPTRVSRPHAPHSQRSTACKPSASHTGAAQLETATAPGLLHEALDHFRSRTQANSDSPISIAPSAPSAAAELVSFAGGTFVPHTSAAVASMAESESERNSNTSTNTSTWQHGNVAGAAMSSHSASPQAAATATGNEGESQRRSRRRQTSNGKCNNNSNTQQSSASSFSHSDSHTSRGSAIRQRQRDPVLRDSRSSSGAPAQAWYLDDPFWANPFELYDMLNEALQSFSYRMMNTSAIDNADAVSKRILDQMTENEDINRARSALSGKFEGSSSYSPQSAAPSLLAELENYQVQSQLSSNLKSIPLEQPTSRDSSSRSSRRKRSIISIASSDRFSPQPVSVSSQLQSSSQHTVASATANRKVELSSELSTVFSRTILNTNSSDSNNGANSRVTSPEQTSRSRSQPPNHPVSDSNSNNSSLALLQVSRPQNSQMPCHHHHQNPQFSHPQSNYFNSIALQPPPPPFIPPPFPPVSSSQITPAAHNSSAHSSRSLLPHFKSNPQASLFAFDPAIHQQYNSHLSSSQTPSPEELNSSMRAVVSQPQTSLECNSAAFNTGIPPPNWRLPFPPNSQFDSSFMSLPLQPIFQDFTAAASTVYELSALQNSALYRNPIQMQGLIPFQLPPPLPLLPALSSQTTITHNRHSNHMQSSSNPTPFSSFMPPVSMFTNPQSSASISRIEPSAILDTSVSIKSQSLQRDSSRSSRKRGPSGRSNTQHNPSPLSVEALPGRSSTPLSARTGASGVFGDSGAMDPTPDFFDGQESSSNYSRMNFPGQQQTSPEQHEAASLPIPTIQLSQTSLSNALLPTSYYSVLDELPVSLSFSLGAHSSGSQAELTGSGRNTLAVSSHSRAHQGSLMASNYSQIQAASNTSIS